MMLGAGACRSRQALRGWSCCCSSSSAAAAASWLLVRSVRPWGLESRRWVARVRLKWVKSRGLDHIIDRDTGVKAALLLTEAISRAPSPSGLVPARSLAPLQKPLGLTVPVLRFLRRYPTLFAECPHPRFPSLPCFSLAPPARLLQARLLDAHRSALPSAAVRLARLLMMTRSRTLPLSALRPLRYDLALPPDFPSSLTSACPDLLRLQPGPAPALALASWPQDLALSALQLRSTPHPPDYRDLKKSAFSSASPLAFPMSFPRGYGAQKKVQAWMEEFHRLPYVSPYEDASGIDPDSELMEKRVVGVLHELLSLTVHKKTHRNYLRGLREELSLPHRFTRVFTRYPGIFYLSLKCKTTTVVLREGYQKGKLVDPHPIAFIRDKFHYVMRTGLLYRGKGMTRLVLDDDNDSANGEYGTEDELDGDVDSGGDDDDEDECYEVETGDDETGTEDD